MNKDQLDQIETALKHCRVLIKYHVKPEKCISIEGNVFSATDIYKEVEESLSMIYHHNQK